MPSHLWHADNNLVRLRLPRFSAAVDPAHSTPALRELQIDRQSLADFDLLGVELPVQTSPRAVVDSYVRGGDLVATYAETAERPFRIQLYWRAALSNAAGAIAAVELVASVQTSLLDVCPQLTTRSLVPGAEVLQLQDAVTGRFGNLAVPSASAAAELSALPPCHVFRPASANYSYAEMVVPSEDQATACEALSHGAGVRLVHRLFAERLEKGVILRARVIGLLVERQDDLAIVWGHYRELLSAAPPLTT